MKKLGILLLAIVVSSFATGCLKRDDLEGIEIYTTTYPVEYITQKLYGDHSTVKSIYPDGVDVENYNLTNKQIKDYSKASMFIFNGLSKEKDYVIPMVNENENIKIIDTTLTMEYNHEMEELWLDPSNFLMLAQNIRNGLKEYINNHYLKNEIEDRYNELRIEVSNLDAELKLISESSDNPVIVVSNDAFKFLEKYGFTVISLEENSNLTDKTVADVRTMIQNETINYIFTMDNEQVNNTITRLQKQTGVQLQTFHSISNLTEEQRNEKKDYITLMYENLELLKNELYD